MKKILSIFLTVVLVFSSLGAFSTSADVNNTFKYGDVNADDFVNNKDLGVLMQYLNNWNVTIVKTAADVNVDNNVNNKDYGLLMQYLNNWDVELGVNNTPTNGVNPDDYRGTEVVFATVILSKTDESGPVIDKFEQEYGITVKEILVGDNVNEIAGKLAAGVNIDVMRTCSDFPAALAVLQPLTAAKLDITDPIWNQSVFKYTTFGGEPYCCDTINNVWTENACVIYSKNLLQRANCYTPREYDAVGKWTWDAYAAIAKAVDSIDGLGTGIRGTYIDDGYLLASAGFQLYKFKDGKFTNGLKDPEHATAFAKIASWNKEGFVTNLVADPFVKGNVGIICGLGWSLKKNGSNANYSDWDDIGFYTLPAYKEGMKPGGTAMFKAWGICRGADNPVGAGLFLRYYLDANNYDTQDIFISPEAETFFFRMTEGITMDNFYPQFTSGDSTENLTGFFEWDWEKIAYGDPTQVDASFDKLASSVDKACDVLNNFVAKNTGQR